MLQYAGQHHGPVLAVVAALLIAVLASTEGFRPRRILFAKCNYQENQVVKPKSVFMSCANSRGICEVRAGNSHILRAVFVPSINATDVDSYVRWNTFLEVPLPGQRRDACAGPLSCPVHQGEVTRFTYNLEIQNFWPRSEFPVVWSLTDRATDREMVCFKFKINIV